MARLCILICVLSICVAFSAAAFPSRYRFKHGERYPRSIREEHQSPFDIATELAEPLPSKSEVKEMPTKESGPEENGKLVGQNDFEGPRDREGPRGPEKISDLYGELEGRGGEPEGPRGTEESPGGPFKGGPQLGHGAFQGPGLMGPGFPMGPDGRPCFDKRCNPFRSNKPSYRQYLRRYKAHHGRMMGPKYFHQLPEYTEVIIIRRVPIMLSKLLVIAAASAGKDKHPEMEEKPFPSGPEQPPGVSPPEPVLYSNKGVSKDGKEVTLQKDEPQFNFIKTEHKYPTKGEPKYDEKRDPEFEELMGQEKMVPVPKNDREPVKEERNMTVAKVTDEEYLEKPKGDFGNENEIEEPKKEAAHVTY